jgi:hypothetical protein
MTNYQKAIDEAREKIYNICKEERKLAQEKEILLENIEYWEALSEDRTTSLRSVGVKNE